MEELEQKLPEMPETVTETVGAVEAAETAEIAGSGKVENAAEASEIAKDTDAGETEAEKSAEDPEKAVETVYRVVDIRFRSGGKTYFFDPGELMLLARRRSDHRHCPWAGIRYLFLRCPQGR